MANDTSDPSYSPSSTASPASPPSPAMDEEQPLTRLKSVSNAAASPPFLGSDRRTQSATDLASVRNSSPTTSTASSPRNSITEALSRSSSFFAAINNNISMLASAAAPPSPLGANEPVHAVQVVYTVPGPLFVDLYSRADGHGAFVKAFRRKPDGSMGNAEASTQVRVNDMLYSINGQVVTEMLFATIIQAAKTTTFPCTLVFHSRLPPRSASTDTSSSALPAKAAGPVTPTWSSKFGQMMAESNLKRSSSFERRPNGDAVPSPVRRPSSGQSTPGTPPLNGSNTVQKNWGETLNLEKVKNSDGVKNLFRMMGGRSRPEEDRTVVEAWFDQLELIYEDQSVKPDGTDGHLASPLVITSKASGGRILGVKDDDLNEFSFDWYRKTKAQDLIQVKGVRGGRYLPSIDDVDSRISVRCQSLRFTNLIRVVEFPRTIIVDPEVQQMVDILLEAGAGAFSATLSSNEHDSFQIKMSEERVTLTKISEEEDEGGVVVSAEYHLHLQVLLDPTDQLRFTLKVQEFGGMLGCRAGDTCDVKKKAQLAGVSCFFLVAQNPQHRDILALLIRRFRARAVIKEEEEIAHRDELNLFVDPASSIAAEQTHDTSNNERIPEGSRTGFSARRSVSPADPRKSSKPQENVLEPPVSLTLADMFASDANAMQGLVSTSDVTAPSSRTASFTVPPSVNGDGVSLATAAIDRSTFVQDRLVAQEKEITMLQDKLASLSVLIKSTEHEKAELASSVEVKDSRIESHQMRIAQLERANLQLLVSSREQIQLRARLEEETKQHQACQQQLVKARKARHHNKKQEQSTQTDSRVEIPDSHRLAMEQATAQVATLTEEVQELKRDGSSLRHQVTRLQSENQSLIGERNSFRARSAELSKELKLLLGPHRSVNEVRAQLEDRNQLAMQLSVARAEAKRAADEMSEYKETLDSVLKQQQQSGLADKDKGATQRILSHNNELQRLVHQLTDSLNETREQMTAMKKINTALVAKMQQDDPDFRGSIVESPPMSPFSNSSSVQDPRFSGDEEEEDDDDEDDGDGDP